MKKAISPLISVVLLVGLTVALIATITTWSFNLAEKQKGFVETQQERLDLSDLNVEILNIRLGEATRDDITTVLKFSNNNDQVINGFIIQPLLEDGKSAGKTIEEPDLRIQPFSIDEITFTIPLQTDRLKLYILTNKVIIEQPHEIKIPK